MAKAKKQSELWLMQKDAQKETKECEKCKRLVWCTVDHIIPHFFIDSVGLRVEGYDHKWNFQYLCRPCQTLKGARFDFTDPRTMRNLQMYLDILKRVYG